MDSIEKDYVVGVYSKIANHFSDTRFNQWPWVIEYLEIITSPDLEYPVVLDVGCGNGRNMDQLEKDYVYGIDNCQEFVDICIQCGKNVSLGDMTDIHFPDDVFDHLLSIASFHHLSTEERRLEALREMHRVTKDGGSMLLSVWSIDQPPDTKQAKNIQAYSDTMVSWDKYGEKYERYYYIFEVEELKRLFKETGWKVKSHSWEYGNEVFILQK
tara:strand:+ start:543 stop:1181 length:639 start_codon:yes stop_codon:yes gene_type:complete